MQRDPLRANGDLHLGLGHRSLHGGGQPLPVAEADDEQRLDGGRLIEDEQIRGADEVGDEGSGRLLVQRAWVGHLLHPTVAHHRDPVGHGQRFFLVVRHVQERRAGGAMDFLQLGLHLLAQLEIERAERLVEQERMRVG